LAVLRSDPDFILDAAVTDSDLQKHCVDKRGNILHLLPTIYLTFKQSEVLSQKGGFVYKFRPSLHTANKIRLMYSIFLEMKLRGLVVPLFQIYVSASDLYIPTIGPPILLQFLPHSFFLGIFVVCAAHAPLTKMTK